MLILTIFSPFLARSPIVYSSRATVLNYLRRRRSFNLVSAFTIVPYIHTGQEVNMRESNSNKFQRYSEEAEGGRKTSACRLFLEDFRGKRDSLYHAVTVDWNL